MGVERLGDEGVRQGENDVAYAWGREKRMPAGQGGRGGRLTNVQGRERIGSVVEVAAAAAAVLAAVLLVRWRVLLLGEIESARDALTFVRPAHQFLAAALARGRVPEWSDWVGLGGPFAADPWNGVAYPFNWLLAALPPARASDLLASLHLAIAGWGAAALARRLGAGLAGACVAGAVLVASGYFASMPANGYTHIACWLPWTAWAADRVARPASPGWPGRALAIASLSAAFGMQLIVAEPLHLMIAGMLVVSVLLARAQRPREAAAGGVIAVAGAALLAAASLLPMSAYLGWSSRSGGMATVDAARWSLAPVRLLELVWPGLLGPRLPPGGFTDAFTRVLDPSTGTTWAYSLYVGGPVLAIAAWTAIRGERVERRLALASLVFVVLALGPATPAYDGLGAVVPLLRYGRSPEKFISGAVLLWSVLAGLGFGRLLRAGAERALLALAGGAAAALGFALVVAATWSSAIERVAAARTAASMFPVDGPAALGLALRSGAWALTIGALALVALGLTLGRHRWLGAVVLAGVLLGDLVWRAQALTSPIPAAQVDEVPPILARLQVPSAPALRPRLWWNAVRHATPADYASPEALARYTQHGLFQDVAASHGLAVLPGFAAMENGALRRFLHEEGVMLLGIDLVLAQASHLPAGSSTLAVDPGLDAALVVPVVRRPRAFVAPRWSRFASVDDVAPRPGALVDLASVALPAPGDISPLTAEGVPPGTCTAASPVPEHVTLDCTSTTGGWAVLLEATGPGWSATVDGVASPIAPADALFRAVRVDAGAHRIEFTYRTPWLRAGAGIACLAWLTLGLVVAAAAVRRKRIA